MRNGDVEFGILREVAHRSEVREWQEPNPTLRVAFARSGREEEGGQARVVVQAGVVEPVYTRKEATDDGHIAHAIRVCAERFCQRRDFAGCAG